MKKIAVIGSGIGGLSAALHLKAKGYSVVVVEKNDWVGGKIREFSSQGYRFDKGPSLFTSPYLVDDVFTLFGKNPRDYYSYFKLNEACRYFNSNGESLVAYGNLKDFCKEIEEKINPDIALKVSKYIQNSYKNYNLSLPLFINQNKGLLSQEGLKMMINYNRMGIFKSLNTYNIQKLKHPFLVKIFNRFATYNGSNPFKAPAVLNCIPALEHGEGSFFPVGGIYSIAKAMHRLALEEGVEFILNHQVKELKQKGKKWIVSDLGDFDAVVINGDYFTTQNIFPEKYQKKVPDISELSSSGVVFYWGVNRVFSNLGVHNILFSDNYKYEFDLLEKGEVGEDLTVYIHISSKVEKSDAPEGAENWFVMVNVPPFFMDDTQIDLIKRKVIQKINSILKIDIESFIDFESVFHPKNIFQDTSGFNGALYGYNSNSLNSMLKRPKNKSDIPGVYYSGGTVFPGGGIPLCMSSGKITASLI